MDGPIGKVFTDVGKTSDATAANLIAGTKPLVLKPTTTTYTSYSVVPDYFINLQTSGYGITLGIAEFTRGISQGGIITKFYFKTSDTNAGYVYLLFYNRVTKSYRTIKLPDETTNVSWNANRTYSGLAISFSPDECLVVRPTTRHVNAYVQFNIEYYLGNLGS